MTNMQIMDELVKVSCTIDSEGDVSPQNIIWRNKNYTVISVGRQWDEEDGRYVLVETADGTRFELLFADLRWRIKKVWWGQMMV